MTSVREARFVVDPLLKPVFVYKHFLLFRKERRGRRPTDRPTDRSLWPLRLTGEAEEAWKQAGERERGGRRVTIPARLLGNTS